MGVAAAGTVATCAGWLRGRSGLPGGPVGETAAGAGADKRARDSRGEGFEEVCVRRGWGYRCFDIFLLDVVSPAWQWTSR